MSGRLQSSRRRAGLTLIELMVVALIITVLALFSTAHFVEMHNRAKVARARADMQTLSGAIEHYRLDNGAYPLPYGGKDNYELGVTELTTPIAYLTSLPADPFANAARWGGNVRDAGDHQVGDAPFYKYFNFSLGRGVSPAGRPVSTWMQQVYDEHPSTRWAQGFNRPAFLVSTVGPSGSLNVLEWHVLGDPSMTTIDAIYDPSNGTMSEGDIGRVGGEPRPVDLASTTY